MDGFSTTASVIAVIELSAKVGSLCAQYCTAVKNAKTDITRLRCKVESLNSIVKDCRDLLDGQHGSKLESSRRLRHALNECSSNLEKLKNKLEPLSGHKTMSRLGIRALRWPFNSGEVDRIILELHESKDEVALAMQVDQT